MSVRLADSLEPVDLDRVRTLFPSQHFLVSRLLGAEPLSATYALLHEPTLLVRDAIIPPFLHVPFCDLGMAFHPRLRSAIMFIASRAIGCSYCQAHCVGIGSLGAGGGTFCNYVADAASSSVTTLNSPDAEPFTPMELAAFHMAAAVGSCPATVSLKHRIELAKAAPAKWVEPIVHCAVIMGWLSRFMDTIGMPLEYEALVNAREVADKIGGWIPAKHVVEADTPRLDTEKGRARQGDGLFGTFAIMRHVLGAKISDGRNKKDIPVNLADLRVLFTRKGTGLGFLPYYLIRMESDDCRAAVAYAIVKGLLLDDTAISRKMKWLVSYLHAILAESPILQAHFAFLAVKEGVELDLLSAVRNMDFSSLTNKKERLALEFAARTGGPAPCALDEPFIKDLCSGFSQEEVMVLVETASTFGLLRNLTAAFPPAAYEPEIKAFLATEEARKVVTYVEVFEDWDALVAEALQDATARLNAKQ